MTELKIRRIGNSLGAVLPKEVLKRLKVSEGDKLCLTESPEGFKITSYDEDFALAMKAFERSRKRYRNALRELAKR